VTGVKLPDMEARRVRDLITGGHSKAAVELAKDLHKRSGTAESESLLLDAYQCRIGDLLKLGMVSEARALLKMVGERFPGSRLRWGDLQREICVVNGEFEELLAPLRDSNLPLEERSRIEGFIRQRLYDLSALAATSSLQSEHPLRVAAAALATAFNAATRGAVDDEVLALPQVSHRSALAPWKALVRAIASFYGRQDDDCRKWLLAIPNDSVPARLIPSITTMLGVKAVSDFSPAEQRLMAATGAASAALRPALGDLEAALAGRKTKPILEAARAAVAACDRCIPRIGERLRQHITLRCAVLGIPRTTTGPAIGYTSRGDASFLRLLARALEHAHDEDSHAEAVLVWEEFRREAINEKWFAAGSLEDGVLSLHMAQLVASLCPDPADEFEWEQPFRRDRKNGALGPEELQSPEALYERACRADPSPDAFQMWLGWAEKYRSWQDADNVAERWRQARPRDVKPLLYLMDSAEKRGAYKKSLKYLEGAEELDRLNPEVRRAKLRLLLSAAVRHLTQRKTHLALTEIERIEALPEVREGEVAALAAALRRTCAALDQDAATLRMQEDRLIALLGGMVPAFVLIHGVAKAARLGAEAKLPVLDAPSLIGPELLTGVARACALGDSAGLSSPLPGGWEEPLIKSLNQTKCRLDTSQMLILGEAALRSEARKLAYAVSVAGLTAGAADSRFLFLRGKSFPVWLSLRCEGCLRAALELARRERDTELAGKILDQLRGRTARNFRFGLPDELDLAGRPLAPELLDQILEEERDEIQAPTPSNRLPRYVAKLGPPPCDCPHCRAGRGEAVEDDNDEYEDDEDEDEFEDDDLDPKAVARLDETLGQLQKFLDSFPPQIARQIEEAIARGEPPEVAAPRIFGTTPPELKPMSSEKKERTAKVAPPEQGNLF
jgi:hypothetical protein